mmetsp:Transcript_11567/g.28858  ORF Transcript_11567/g.28858 Transcript_11567/m.28858 type:complete len:256 (-) Transcript_11567:720-1487(-)
MMLRLLSYHRLMQVPACTFAAYPSHEIRSDVPCSELDAVSACEAGDVSSKQSTNIASSILRKLEAFSSLAPWISFLHRAHASLPSEVSHLETQKWFRSASAQIFDCLVQRISNIGPYAMRVVMHIKFPSHSCTEPAAGPRNFSSARMHSPALRRQKTYSLIQILPDVEAQTVIPDAPQRLFYLRLRKTNLAVITNHIHPVDTTPAHDEDMARVWIKLDSVCALSRNSRRPKQSGILGHAQRRRSLHVWLECAISD